jgi:hypothetical protein
MDHLETNSSKKKKKLLRKGRSQIPNGVSYGRPSKATKNKSLLRNDS